MSHEAQDRTAELKRSANLAAARKKYGKPFCYESGSRFEWKSGPTVLDQWLMKRRMGK